MKKQIIFIACTFLLIHTVHAQQRKIERADKKYDKYAFITAIDIYERVANKGYQSAELYKKLGNAYYFNAKYEDAAKWYEQLTAMRNVTIEPEYYFRYAQSLKATKEYTKADGMMDMFNKAKGTDSRAALYTSQQNYLEQIKLQSDRYDIALATLNSTYSDFAPSFYKEGLIFSSARDTGVLTRYKHSWDEQPFLDLYTSSEVNKEQATATPVKLSKNINTRYHESTTTFTKDGQTMYFTRSNYNNKKYGKDAEGINKLKIYKATLHNGNWSNITELPFNSDDFSCAHPTLSTDEKQLYFASDRPGSYGLSDIYSVAIHEDGSYSKPINLGKEINTEGRETFPFMSTSGKLYFASDGHPGLGGLDIFVAEMEKPSSIHNIGSPVNGPKDDFSFIIDEAKSTGYFASNRDGGVGSDDIYFFIETIPLVTQCEQVVTGVITDKNRKTPIPNAQVLVINTKNELLQTVVTDSEGTYKVTIDCTQDHFMRATKETYTPSETLVSASYGTDTLTINFELEKETVTAGIGDDLAQLLQLKPIYFDFDKAKIRKDAEIELEKVVAAMEKYPSIKIDIRAHTDSRANDAYNMRLSEKRAKATIDYLIKQGIGPSRITGRGYGETQLVNECGNGVPCSIEKHQLNRRSEFVIME
ncbi:OmpA family protein [Leptobacterium sp. I13]|uniref:OmpA family protein n=1 Tax=Leptobacterium meishanense TaxID=3128904 RepID=UPI0030EE3BA8